MVYAVGILAALFLGIGYVLQQRIAAQAALDDLLSTRLIRFLIRQKVWWLGIGATVVGAGLSGLALHFASVSTVEPLISASLLFALVLANVLSHHGTCWQEIGGAVLVTAALTVFLTVGRPRANDSVRSDHYLVTLALVITFGIALLLIVIGRNRGRVLESVLLSTAAGVLSGIQDAATRAGLVDIKDHGLLATVVHPWIWVVTVAGISAIVISQSGFKAARLDYSLPPLTVAEPLVGIALGISLLGDQLAVTPTAIALESLSIAAMVAGVVLISRSPSLASPRRGVLVRH